MVAETQSNGIALVRDDGGIEEGGNCGDEKKWTDLRHMMESLL